MGSQVYTCVSSVAAVQYGDSIAHAHRLRLIVGYENGSDAQRVRKLRQFVPHFLAEQRVERGQRFIKQNADRLHRDGAGERHALLLTAGKLMRIALFKILQMHGAQCAAHAAL